MQCIQYAAACTAATTVANYSRALLPLLQHKSLVLQLQYKHLAWLPSRVIRGYGP